jgi:anhydro-N-acetylmuramic acid kinase
MFTNPQLNRAIQNIGGIANVTYLPAAAPAEEIIAFDTGPGNMIIDHVVTVITDGRELFDHQGRIGSGGSVHRDTLADLMKNDYFRRTPPKTTGRELFGRSSAETLLKNARATGLDDQDIVATATAFTAASIANAYQQHLPASPDEVILCGGGTKNKLLVRMLTERLAPMKIMTTDDLGVNSEAKEAISFALLALLTAGAHQGNAPSATGAQCPVILGNITPASRTP